MYNIILPVRFGLLQQRDPEMFEWLLQNMDHNQERNNNEEMFQSTDRKDQSVSRSNRMGFLFSQLYQLYFATFGFSVA